MHFHPNQNDSAINQNNMSMRQRPAQGSMLNKWTNQEIRPMNMAPPMQQDSFDEKIGFDSLHNHFGPFANSQHPANGPFPGPPNQMPNFSEGNRQQQSYKATNVSQIWSSPSGNPQTNRQNFPMNPHFNQRNMPMPPNHGNPAMQRDFIGGPRPQQLNNFNGRDPRQMAQMPPSMGFPPGGPIMPPNMMPPNSNNGTSRMPPGARPPFPGPTVPNSHNVPNMMPSNHLMNIGNLPSGVVPPMPPHMNYRQQQPPHQAPMMPDLGLSHLVPPAENEYNPALYWKEPEDPLRKRQLEMGTLHWGDPKQWNERPIKFWKDAEESENFAPSSAAYANGGGMLANFGRQSGSTGWDEDVPEAGAIQRRNVTIPPQPFQNVTAGNSENPFNGDKSAFNRGGSDQARMGIGKPWGDDVRGALNVSQAGAYGNNRQNNVDPYLFEDEFSRLSFDQPLDNDLFR